MRSPELAHKLLQVLLPPSRQLKAYSAEPGLQRLIDLVPPDLWAARLALPVRPCSCQALGWGLWSGDQEKEPRGRRGYCWAQLRGGVSVGQWAWQTEDTIK